MREWFLSLFDKNLGGLEINLFDFWHIGYLLLAIGGIILTAFLLRKKSEKTQRKFVNALIIIAVISYVLDFFVQPLYRGGEMDVDKLPFHICTFISIVAIFARFNKKFAWLNQPAVVLCIVAPLMYLCYPGSALGGVSPIGYKVVQTFFYHSMVLAYGVLSLTTKSVKLSIKGIWKEFFMILFIALWASIGNAIYADYDWFFLKGSAFPFIPVSIMPLVVIVAVFLMVLIIYGIYTLVYRHYYPKVKPVRYY
ncbi:MAG: hypothetical protein E7378_03710 [Clostridiales bacterium]|nr:hypothetical protein [Clostridiales bacterium]